MIEARQLPGTEAEVQRECIVLMPSAQLDAQVCSKANETDSNDSRRVLGDKAFLNAQGGLCALGE